MSKTVELDLPQERARWRETVELARDAYWTARRRGMTENDAISVVVDVVLPRAT